MKMARTQPPVGYRVATGDLVRALAPRGDSTLLLEREFAAQFGVGHVFTLSSGKAALTVTLSALRALTGRRKVIFPAYTCYSVPSAIVKAGLDPVPCDIAPGSFDYDYEQLRPLLGPDVLCALSVHLFGIPADTERLTAACRPAGIFVVEDAAQAMDPDHERPLGTRGDAGIFSLGRGKNITSGSGGLIVTGSDAIGAAVASIVNGLPRRDVQDGLTAFVTLGLLSVFISPRLYWLPAGLPFLKLGETIFHEDFPVRRLSALQARVLGDWRGRLSGLNAARRAAAEYYLAHVSGARQHADGIAYLRFPLMLDARARRDLLQDKRTRRLGISAMYPATVGRIPQLAGRLAQTVFPQAERVAAALVTLPTHPLLSAGDLASIRAVVNARSGSRSLQSRVA